MGRCNSCGMYVYHVLKRCNNCGLLKSAPIDRYDELEQTIELQEENIIERKLNKIYSRPNERFLNQRGHYKGVKNSEAKTQ